MRVKTEGIEPKVIMAAEPKPGGMPRALEIHRRTKLYASQDITALLKERGIDYSQKFTSEVFGKVGAPSTKLPLEAFDDASYEVRGPQDWLAYGEALPCKALVLDDDEVGVGTSDRNGLRLETKDSTPSRSARLPRAGAAAAPSSSSSSVVLVVVVVVRRRLMKSHCTACTSASRPRTRSTSPIEWPRTHTDEEPRRRRCCLGLCVDCMPTEGCATPDADALRRVAALGDVYPHAETLKSVHR